MRLTLNRTMYYESRFDPKSGNLARNVEMFTMRHSGAQIERAVKARFPNRSGGVPSPSPELIDVSITDKCGFGCSYCYQNSTAKGEHAPADLIPKLINGLDYAPYQIAIGGGEPTGHPDFVSILRETRKLGTVPNYTTAGHIFKPEVIDATNNYCGGVAITYHAFKGIDWFKKTYQAWHEALKCQVNIHLIADKNVADNLDMLMRLQDELKQRFSVVLLAYYPDVGRASLENLMTRRVYTQNLPAAIKSAREHGITLAFSEGLLPYFLSRPELGINTAFSMRSEGFFSCYVDPRGHMSSSSFDDPKERSEKTVFQVKAQTLWEDLKSNNGWPDGPMCGDCSRRNVCSAPHAFHLLTCAFAPHNSLPLAPLAAKSRYDLLDDED